MNIIKFCFFLSSLIIPGILIIGLFIKDRKPFLYLLALAYGVGASFVGLQLFIFIFIFKINISLLNVYSILISETIFLFYFRAKKLRYENISQLIHKILNYRPDLKNIRIYHILMLLLIFIQIVFLFFNATSRPPVAYDNISLWQYKSKILFYEKKINFDPQKFAYLGGGGHLNYPWQVPLLQNWLYANIDEFNNQEANFINLFYYLAILIIIYYFLKNYLTNFISLFFVWLFSTMPLVFYHAYNGYADLTLSYYLLLNFIFLFHWLETQEKKYLIVAGVFLSCALMVKNDALIFAISGMLIILLRHLFIDKKILAGIKDGAVYLLTIALPLLPWLFIKAKYHLIFSNIEPGINYHPEVLTNIYQALLFANSFNVWWFIVIISLLLNIVQIKRQKSLALAWLFLIFSILGFIILYLFTEEYRYVIDNTALSRNFLTLVPISIIIAALSFKSEPQIKLAPTKSA